MSTLTTTQTFLTEDFLLQSESARLLYHEYAHEMPIIDYHNHLPPQEIAEDKIFDNLSQAWLYGDHYKWRAMRTNGVAEGYCTGDKSDYEKFEQWAATVPYTLRNPLVPLDASRTQAILRRGRVAFTQHCAGHL